MWDYRPPESTPRNGLRLINMNREQQAKALAVLDIGLSTRGAQQVRQIIDLETPLRERSRSKGASRRSSAIPSTTPSASSATRAAGAVGVARRGHHVGLHVTVVDGDRISSAPLFFGANPAKCGTDRVSASARCPTRKTRPRARPQSCRRTRSGSPSSTRSRPPTSLLTRTASAYPFNVPRGLSYSAMAGDQRGLLRAADSALRRADDG